MDIFSRKGVGWRLGPHEDSILAAELIEKIVAEQDADPTRLTIHADRGPSMTSGEVYDLFQQLEITPSHSRPHVSDDNPYSESQFKTLKYCSAYPGRFDTIDTAREWVEAFIDWYNNEHRHSRIRYHTPASVHDGTAATLRDQRQVVLDNMYGLDPARFRNKPPVAPHLPTVAWINQPTEKVQTLA